MKFFSVPAYSFGGRYGGKNKSGESGPGPGNYKIPNSGLDPKGYSLPKSKRNITMGNSAGDLGPGSYKYNSSSFGKGGVSIKGRNRKKLE